MRLSFRGTHITIRLVSAYSDTRLLADERVVLDALLNSYAASSTVDAEVPLSGEKEDIPKNTLNDMPIHFRRTK